jgi:CheY-like chemotaxis protein
VREEPTEVPRHEDALCPLAADGCSPSTPARGRLLVVDDNAAVRTMVRRLAQAWGYLCGEAPDGLAAVAAGARAVLWKPLQPALLRETIAELVPDGDAQAPCGAD